MSRPSPHQCAAEVRAVEGLPDSGRGDLSDIARVEAVVRAALYPDIPTYDVNSVQGPGFEEFCYSDAFGCLCLWTQSVEINTRLALAAVATDYDDGTDPVARLVVRAGDKWAGQAPAELAPGRKLWCPPGANLAHLVDVDHLLRVFDGDARWICKPHPITPDEDVERQVSLLGATRVLPREASVYHLMSTAAAIGHTTSSELGIVAMMRGIPVLDFSLYRIEHTGRLYSLYRAVRASGCADPRDALRRLLWCPWSGVIPLDAPDGEARWRTKAFKAKSLELREKYRPLVPRAG